MADISYFRLPEMKSEIEAIIKEKEEKNAAQRYLINETWEPVDTSNRYGLLYQIENNGKTITKSKEPSLINIIRGKTILENGIWNFLLKFDEIGSDREEYEGVGFAVLCSSCFGRCGLYDEGGIYVSTDGQIFVDEEKYQDSLPRFDKGDTLELTLNQLSKTVIFSAKNTKVVVPWKKCEDRAFLCACFRYSGWKLSILS